MIHPRIAFSQLIVRFGCARGRRLLEHPETEDAAKLYGFLKTSWSPTRRHRQRSSPSTVTSSKVARPSGLANDHVISRMPGAVDVSRRLLLHFKQVQLDVDTMHPHDNAG